MIPAHAVTKRCYLPKNSASEMLLLGDGHLRELPAGQPWALVTVCSHAQLFPQSVRVLFQVLILENKSSDENKLIRAGDALVEG